MADAAVLVLAHSYGTYINSGQKSIKIIRIEGGFHNVENKVQRPPHRGSSDPIRYHLHLSQVTVMIDNDPYPRTLQVPAERRLPPEERSRK